MVELVKNIILFFLNTINSGCGEDGVSLAVPVAIVKSIEISGNQNVIIGQSIRLDAILRDKDDKVVDEVPNDEVPSWNSDNSTIAFVESDTVNKFALIKGVSVGEVIINCISNDVSSTIKITVEPEPIKPESD